jgi:hypothetical protein
VERTLALVGGASNEEALFCKVRRFEFATFFLILLMKFYPASAP